MDERNARAHLLVSAPTTNRPAAGGRSSNARPDCIVGHVRGNLRGAQDGTSREDFLERVSLAEKRDAMLPRQYVEPRNPIKGHGTCNPLVEYVSDAHAAMRGIQLMPNMGGTGGHAKHLGAAGESSTEGWRSTTNYMAHGAESYGDFRSEHLALQPSTKLRARNLQPESQVVFGDDSGGSSISAFSTTSSVATAYMYTR